MKQKNTFKAMLVITAIALLSSCSQTLQVTTDYDRSANFSTYKTFRFSVLATTVNVNELNQDRIINSIRREMTRKGYVENNNNPDLVITALTILKNKKQLSISGSNYGSFYTPRGYWGVPSSIYGNVQAHEYKDGTLLIDITDTKTEKLVWEGKGYSTLTKQPKNPEEVTSRAVSKIMASFPSGSQKNIYQ
jgi:hypothetical protein